MKLGSWLPGLYKIIEIEIAILYTMSSDHSSLPISVRPYYDDYFHLDPTKMIKIIGKIPPYSHQSLK